MQPSRRPTDGRYGNNPFRLQHYYQFQVSIKPSPDDFQELYLGSLRALGFDLLTHDIRFVEDNWESPTLGAWGLGWEVWLNGMEVSQFTYFQQVGGLDCRPVMGEITYGLERLAMYIQGKESIFDIVWTEGRSAPSPTATCSTRTKWSNRPTTSRRPTRRCCCASSTTHEQACRALLEDKLVLPAYEQMVKASHCLQSAGCAPRGLRDRTAALHPARAHAGACRRRGLPRQPRGAGLPAARKHRPRAGRLMSDARPAVRAAAPRSCRRATLLGAVDALTAGHRSRASTTPASRTARRTASRRRAVSRCCVARCRRARAGPAAWSGAGRRSPAAFDAAGAPTQAATAFAQELRRRRWRISSRLTTEKGAWLVFRGTERGAPRPTAARRHRHAGRRGAAHRQAHALGNSARRSSCGRCTAWCCCTATRWCPSRCSASPRAGITCGHRFHAPQAHRRSRRPEAYESAPAPRQGDRGFREAPRDDSRRGDGARPPQRGGTALIEDRRCSMR